MSSPDPQMRLPDPARSRAVLIGCAGYTELDALPTVARGAAALREVLADPTTGGFARDTCELLLDPADAAHVGRRLLAAARSAEDTLLVYYGGHGVLDDGNRLHLALAGTSREQGLVPFTALLYDNLRAILRDARARNRIVILDCCFAGRAVDDMAGGDLFQRAAITGSYVLTATGADQTARGSDGRGYTAFTGALLQLLRSGLPDGPHLLTLDGLYPRLREALTAAGLPEPRRQGVDRTPTALALTRNPCALHPERSVVHPEQPHLGGGPARFACEVFQNEFLPEGGTEVHAVVAMTCAGAGAAGWGGDAAEIIIVGTPDSMRGQRIESARRALRAAVDEVVDGTWFAVIAGSDTARTVFPGPYPPTLVRMDPQVRAAARDAVSALTAGGGTAMGSWLRAATRLFASVPEVTRRHAVLVTDSPDHVEAPEELDAAVREATGVFRCDCRGLGADWDVRQLRGIATALLGTVDIVPAPDQLPQELADLVRRAMGRRVADARLQLRTPQNARVLFVRQVSPQVEDLTGRRVDLDPTAGSYPTGAWGEETREYYLAVRLPARPAGTEQLAARVELVISGEVLAQGLVKARWSRDGALTTPFNPAVVRDGRPPTGP